MAIPALDLRSALGTLTARDEAGRFIVRPGAGATNELVSAATTQVAEQRAALETAHTRLAVAATKLQVESANVSAAVPRISDVDAAEEATRFARFNILERAGTALAAQANHSAGAVLRSIAT